jgi:hypothetical protein
MIEDALKPDKSGLEKLFESIEARTEILAKPTGVEAEWLAREDRWLKEKCGMFSSSICPKLMQSGRSKGEDWGKDAITILLTVAHERRTGFNRPVIRGVKSMEWGKMYEGEALEFYRNKENIDMKSGTNDFDEIVLVKPLPGFVDSPDGITSDFIGRAEIKCHESGAIHYSTLGNSAYSESDPYYWQYMGHLLDERAEWVDHISYDPRSKDDDPFKMNVIRIYKMDHKFNLTRLKERIEKANRIIDLALENNDISIIKNVNNL